MTIVPATRLDRHDLVILGDNVRTAIRDDHDEAAMQRSLDCHDDLDRDGQCNATSRPSILTWRS